MPGPRRTVVVAPDSFKGSLPAREVAEAVATGLRAGAALAGVDLDLRLRPVADGGEGTVAVLVAAGWTSRPCTVTGPTGRPVRTALALSPAGASTRTAVVELAGASGLGLLPGGRSDPLRATTYGTGQLVAAALDEGVDRLVLALGGSATTDGGCGMAAALGARFLAPDGSPLPPGGAALRGLAAVDLRGLDPRLAGVEVLAATDVDNPLTGRRGAARVYAPQKGAGPDDVELLEAALARLAEVLRSDVGVAVAELAGAGAAGGAGGGAVALLGARLVPGIDLVLDLLGFDEALEGADLVVTGEGSLDDQTLSGKAPHGVSRRARAAGVPVLVLAGRVDLDAAARSSLGDLGVVGVRALLDLEPDPAVAVRDAASLLAVLASDALVDLAPLLHGTDATDPTGTTTRSLT